MKKLMKIVLAAVMTAGIAGCSAKADSENAAMERLADAKYTSTFDTASASWESYEYHEVSYEAPKGWTPRALGDTSKVTWMINGAKDVVELTFVEGASDKAAMEDFLANMDERSYCTVLSTEDKTIGGAEGMYVSGKSVVYTTVVLDCNCDMYLVPTATGIVVFRITLDPKGETDYRPVFDHMIESVQIA